MKTLLIILLAPLLLTQVEPEHRAWIATVKQGDVLRIQGRFANDSPQAAQFRYELTTMKQGTAGNSSSTQSGYFEVPAHGDISLSNVSININEEDTYIIELKIFRGETVYLDDQIEYQG